MSGLDREQIENWDTGVVQDEPTGSCASYYDLPVDCVTLNDIIEWKGDTQWLGDSFHLGNVLKAAWRWGIKSGTSKAYDSRKLIYTGCRLLMKHTDKSELRATLLEILNDPQFGVEGDNV